MVGTASSQAGCVSHSGLVGYPRALRQNVCAFQITQMLFLLLRCRMGPWRPKWPCRTHTATLRVTLPPSTIAPTPTLGTSPLPREPPSMRSSISSPPVQPHHQLSDLPAPVGAGRGGVPALLHSHAPYLAGGRTRNQVNISHAQAGLRGALHPPSKSREHPTNSARDSCGLPSTKALWTTLHATHSPLAVPLCYLTTYNLRPSLHMAKSL